MPVAVGDGESGGIPGTGDAARTAANGTSEAGSARRAAEIEAGVAAARDAGVVGGENPVPFLRAAIAELQELGPGHARVEAEAHLALAWFEAMDRGPQAARPLMDRALRLAPALEWKVDLQWAGMLIDAEDGHAEALRTFDRVIPRLPADRDLVIALNNRGVLHNSLGLVDRAAADTLAAADLADRLGLIDFRSAALHNLGISYHYAGDLPLALQHMKDARIAGARVADGAREVDRGRVLFDAGLISEAAEAAETAVRLAAQSRWTNDLALAHVLGAKARAALGDYPSALGHARKAVSVFRDRGADAAADAARLVELRIRLTLLISRTRPVGTTAAVLADRLEDLIPVFLRAGAEWDAAGARIAAAAARQFAGHWSTAAELTDAVGSLSRAPLALRLDLHWVRARALIRAGDDDGALAEIAAGLGELARFQSRLGSQDLQASTSIHGVLLADLALGRVLALDDPALVLEWIERTRAVTARLQTVRPSADPALAARLAEFRAVAGNVRQAAEEGRAGGQARHQVDALRREIRSLAWQGPPGAWLSDGPVGVDRIRAVLAAGADIAVEFLAFAGHLHVVRIDAQGLNHLDLGPEAPVIEMINRLNADLDLLALRRIPSSIRAAATVSRAHLAAALSASLLEPLDLPGTGGVVSIAAVGELAGLAWSVLPALRGVAVRVNSSLTATVQATARVPSGGPTRVVMVWGPDVPHAISEWMTLSNLYPRAELLSGGTATPGSVIEAIADSDLVHFAAHGTHEPENPLFSGLHLHGGPLLAYDLVPADLPPRVVLSACEVGRTTDLPGGEPLGLATVLLRAGVATVIAATSRIADDEAAVVLSDFHRRLAAGEGAPAALAGALHAAGNTVPLTCFGA